MNHAISSISAAALLATLGLVGVVACSNQGEGERCDPNNKNHDCMSGLICRKIEGQKSPLCCPRPPQPASVSACIPGQPLQEDGGTSSDAGSPDAPADVEQDQDAGMNDVEQDTTGDVEQDVADDVVGDGAG